MYEYFYYYSNYSFYYKLISVIGFDILGIYDFNIVLVV